MHFDFFCEVTIPDRLIYLTILIVVLDQHHCQTHKDIVVVVFFLFDV